VARLADLRSREVLRTADELGIPHAHAVGLRELLYATCFQKADPTIGDARDVELSAGWAGERGKFVAAAEAAGMIVEHEEGVFALPDFEDAAPSWVRKRAKRAAERDASGKTVSELRREAGAKGAAARASKRTASGSRLVAVREQTAPLPSLPPSFPPANSEGELRSPRRRARAADPRFDAFYETFPNRVKRKEAAKVWEKLAEKDREEALEGVAIYADVWRSAPPDRQVFAGHPATWLRGERWKESREVWEREAAPRSAPPILRSPDPRNRTATAGMHLAPQAPPREVAPASPPWIKALEDADLSPLRIVIPESLDEARDRWYRDSSTPAPDGWEDALTAAIAEAEQYDRRMTG